MGYIYFFITFSLSLCFTVAISDYLLCNFNKFKNRTTLVSLWAWFEQKYWDTHAVPLCENIHIGNIKTSKEKNLNLAQEFPQ